MQKYLTRTIHKLDGSQEEIFYNLDLLDYLPESKITIGRSKDNHIILADSRISRHHALIKRLSQGELIIEPINNPQNGVYVNRKPVKQGENAFLEDGDSVVLGNILLTYRESR